MPPIPKLSRATPRGIAAAVDATGAGQEDPP
jgi:hypothetical protein